ncbi:MAG: ABC transporter permease [Dehalococcoidia bacterium]
MNCLVDIWYLSGRHIRTRLRTPVWIFVSLVQPMIWLVIFSQLFKNVADLPQFPTENYLQFFAPGVVVMTVLFGAAWAGMGMIEDMDLGILTKMLATPVTRVSIVLSRVLATVITLIVQALLIFLIATMMGVDIATGMAGVLLTVLVISLLGVGLAGLSNALALLLRKSDPLVAVVSFVTMPLMFLSSAMIPGQMLPGWIETARKFNPVDYAVESVRNLVVTGYEWGSLVPNILFLAAFAVVSVSLATAMFRIRAE